MDPMKTTAICALVALAGYVAGMADRRDESAMPVRPGPAVTLAQPLLQSPTVQEDALRLGDQPTSYTCPMHSHIHADHEGKCPICGMDLVPEKVSVAVAGGEVASHAASAGHVDDDVSGHDAVGAAILIDPAVRNNLSVRTAKVERGDLRRGIRTVGKIGRIDPTSRNNISPPIAGTLTALSPKMEGDTVANGEFLFSVGSEELFQLQRDYVDAMKEGRRDDALGLVSQMSEHGISAAQIAELQGGAEPTLSAEVYSPQAGFVFIRRSAVGEPVTSGTMIYSLGANSRAIEVIAEIYEQQWGWVKDNQEAEMTVRSLPGKVFVGRIIRVEPPVGYTTRTLEVRLRFDTDEPELTQGMFSEVLIKGDSRSDVVSVPLESVISTQEGSRVVVVGEDGSFQPVAVITGEESGGMMEIRSGLSGDETVVVSGQFLIDSESNRLAGLARMSEHAAH